MSVDPREVAAAMGISLNLFYKVAASGGLPFPVYRVGKRFVTPREPFERAMRGEAIEKA
jgi:predicted site-specific integrase-resolvase